MIKLNNIKYIIATLVVAIGVSSCNKDDDGGVIIQPPVPPVQVDFSGTFVQEDQMGRAAINTVLNGDSSDKNDFNVTIPSEMVAKFQSKFLDRAVALHDAFGVSYENNILGLDAVTLTTILATDVLQVAPDGPTTYFDAANVLTGRNLTDDVVDISLILLFGGNNGDRFNGQDLDGDGTPDLPILVSDGVDASGETPLASFPYLEAPHM
ncbi:hypothetical protein IWQ47_002145 [Aquimarina sp. EL_43]|uniref:DUF4331 family protein n=1 Tax=unclassified Aquimarina TaxID=2627091 RepID=UPI0018C9F110|nr:MULTISPECIES: DUF4331 family protein [unclassified Aquimarina]MBG6130669.1 hypothetical protein [Aquimarina sp. EL_35]MBG6151185.1 hypothetical protein [Aquimarina sp. EL_32]MBG6169071.1 hypothetical protein [Aquimarina sp. EL_43]